MAQSAPRKTAMEAALLLRSMFSTALILALSSALSPAPAAPAGEARLLRYADIHGDTIAFVYAGDIWTVPSAGGTARRLTTHEGMELFPKFSPDGQWIAFSAEYGGNRQVFVMPTSGGTPRQLTYYNDVGPMPPRGGFDYQVMDWTPDGKEILFRGNRLPWGVRMGRPYLIPFEGGMERPLAVPESGGGMLSPDGTKLVYTPIAREFRTWKRYRGGRAQDVWIYDLEKDVSEQVTTFEGTDNQPVWVGDTIYFTSDRDRRLNLYARPAAGGDVRKVTNHEDFDVLWPSAGPEAVVYECGGYLYRYDPATQASVRVPVELDGDFPSTLRHVEEVGDQIGSVALSPAGRRAVVEARGDVFSVPVEKGETRNLTRSPGVREMAPRWSPDGRWIAYLSDRNGEYDLYVRAQDGSGEERRVTTDCDTWRFDPEWSPDSKKLAFADTAQRLRWVDVESGALNEVDRGEFETITTYRWSPDSNWIAYSKADESRFSSIWVHSLETSENVRLTGTDTNDTQPAFDPEGRYLYFLSDRDFNLTFSGYEFNYFYTEPTRVYAATLQADGPALFDSESDEAEIAPEDDADDETTEEGESTDDAEDSNEEDSEEDEDKLVIDAEGFADRVVPLPGGSASYGTLRANSKGAFWVVSRDSGTSIEMFDVESEKVETVLDGAFGFGLSANGEKLVWAAGGSWGVVDASAGQSKGDTLNFSGVRAKLDPRAEWRQIFVDAWRITRDWFYDEGLHGLDWAAMRALYEPLVEHVAHRADLDYILGELGGELNAGHFYVNWGDFPRPERVNNGLLGADIVADPSGTFRIARILPGENWNPGFRSPLTESGVDVDEGDFILSVDGRSTRDVKNFYELLEAAAGRTVELEVASSPDGADAHVERVRPIARETNLFYLEWIAERRRMVDELSGGRIGYIHLPNTAVEGNRELRKHFYPQAHKDALIFDARYNGGGFIPDRMIELVSRNRLSFWARRGIAPFNTPAYYHDGPKACLMNGYSSSGGDAFPHYFRQVGLGPLIGTRTWGGLIGLSGNPGFMDGGSLAVPTFRIVDLEGNWTIENVGVAPDIEVVDRPELVARGEDPSLERAVAELLKTLEAAPPVEIEVPTPPRYER